MTNSIKFLLAAELEFRHTEVAPFHSKTLDFQYSVWVLYACEEEEDEKKKTFGLGRICRKGEKCHRIVRNGGDDGGGRRVVPCQGVEGGIKQLGRAGAEDYIIPLGSRVAHKPMKKPHVPFQLSRHVWPPVSVVAHPMPRRNHHRTTLRVASPVWLQKNRIPAIPLSTQSR